MNRKQKLILMNDAGITDFQVHNLDLYVKTKKKGWHLTTVEETKVIRDLKLAQGFHTNKEIVK